LDYDFLSFLRYYTQQNLHNPGVAGMDFTVAGSKPEHYPETRFHQLCVAMDVEAKGVFTKEIHLCGAVESFSGFAVAWFLSK
jgi:hypothetical protein